MPNRVQTLRSSAPGNLPQAGTRQPGELWLNFADFALGFIDASQTAQKLLAVRLFINTTSYATGDFAVYAGNLYRAIAPSSAGAFNAANWSKVGTAQDLALYLPLAGGSLTGALTLAANPTAALGAATKQYVDSGDAAGLAAAALMLPLAGGTLTGALNGTTATFSGVAAAADPPAADSSSKLVTTAWFNSHQPVTKENSNRIINGDMRITQYGTSGSVAGYSVDRWRLGMNQASKLSWSQVNSVAMALNGFPRALQLTSLSAYTPAATDSFSVWQAIEADMISDFAFGTANAQPITLSFWFMASVAGTYSGAISNYGPANRSYPFTFVVAAASTWTKYAITIPGDTAGTWTMSGNGGAMYVVFDLGSGANLRGPANAWANGGYNGATGAASLVATNGALVQMVGVKLEIGSVVTPYNRQTMAQALAACQRYYSTAVTFFSGNATSAASYYAPGWLPVTPRVGPTLTGTPSSAAGFPNTIGALVYSGGQLVTDQRTCNATTSGGVITSIVQASAEL